MTGRTGAPFVLALTLITAAAAAAQAPAASARPELRPVPSPPLERTDKVVREQLESYETSLARDLEDPSTDPARLMAGFARLGQLFLLFDLDQAARDCFWNAQALAPDDARWSYYLGVAQERLGEHEEAIETLARVLEARPQDEATLIRLGRLALAQGDDTRAETWFRQALEHRADSAAALHGLGQVAIFRDQWTEAVDLFTRALERQPQASAIHYELGLAYRQLREMDLAREHLTQRGSVKPAFPDPLITGLDSLAVGGRHHVREGGRLYKAGDLAGAERAYLQAIEADPENAGAHESLASILAARGEVSAALTHYREALRIEPDDARAHYETARLLLGSGRLEEAIQHLQQAVRLAPDFVAAFNDLAVALESVGRVPEAVTAARRLARLKPGDSSTLLLVERLALLERIDPGKDPDAELRRILEEDPADGMALLSLAALREGRGNDAGFIDALETVFELPEDDPATAAIKSRAHYLMARHLVRRGQTAEAPGHLEEAVRLAPDLVEIQLARGQLLTQLGDQENAAEAYRLALGLEPHSVPAHLGLARALIRGEKYLEAAKRLDESLAEIPTSQELRSLLAQLLATCPDDRVRNGERALQLARQAFEATENAEHAAAVAMAYAATGEFEQAASWQRRAIDLTGGSDPRAARLEQDLESYQEGRPARAPWLPRR